MVHVGFGHHRGHGGGHIARAEFIFAVLVPQGRIIELRADGALQGRHAALVRHQGGRLVVVVAAGTRERVVHARIHVELHARLAAQRGEDALACLGRTEAILLGNVQHQAAAQVGRLFQTAFDAHAVIAHGHVHIGAARGQIGQLAAQAVAQHAHPALLLGQTAKRGERGRDVFQAQLHVEALIEFERTRHVGRAIG
ncbi:hypothetical protein G6F50_015579 [Rhizopus delemar]|uniref:Uncharacterized protein n=1 Tax=Rhizopus delemar TaxID=936053 RepID=A0A9P7C3R7_9FUNG|nr:hypothetical protein G6F50_015579 [Rhizopus delemar]